jgi:hypothetical protein
VGLETGNDKIEILAASNTLQAVALLYMLLLQGKGSCKLLMIRALRRKKTNHVNAEKEADAERS